MHLAQTGRSAKPNIWRTPAFSAKGWWRRFAYAWIAILLGAALLPCSQMAVAAQAPALHGDCDEAAEHAPVFGDTRQPGSCAVVDVPASASAARLAGNIAQPSPTVVAPLHFSPALRPQARARAYPIAPSSATVLSRSSRLLV